MGFQIFKQRLKEIIYRRYNISFSKSGDDIQLRKLINKVTPGTYVDIGCWDPVKASNTYYFSIRNWKGICIDPNPMIADYFQKMRPNDIFINKGISASSTKSLPYYMLDKDLKSSMNTFDKSFIEDQGLTHKIAKTIDVPTVRLDTLLDKYITVDDRLDFFDVDVEGYDLEVLKTNNWEKYRPKVIMVESVATINEDLVSEITDFLKSKAYTLTGKSLVNKGLGNIYYLDNNQ